MIILNTVYRPKPRFKQMRKKKKKKKEESKLFRNNFDFQRTVQLHPKQTTKTHDSGVRVYQGCPIGFGVLFRPNK